MKDTIYDLIIIGGGAAGLMAAAEAARLGLSVVILESQPESGQKILITGGGRCNVTNKNVSEKDYQAGCRHTLRHVLAGFPSSEAVAFFEKWGAKLTLEGDEQYFSETGKAKAVRDALFWAVQVSGARLICNAKVTSVVREGDHFNVVVGSGLFTGRYVLITTGGLSYSGTGSDGSGYKLARAFGHTIIPTRPALTPLVSSRKTFVDISGIAVPVALSLWVGQRKVHVVNGSMLFTHQGFSGPVAMNMSGFWLKSRGEGDCQVRADLLPAIKGEGLPFLNDAAVSKRSIKNVLTHYFPERLVLVLVKEAQVDPQRIVCELTAVEKRSLGSILRSCPLHISDTQGYAKAEATSGGVDLKELKGATLESRLQEGLYFAGEIVDVDGRIGGFNLQWAWASGVASARAIARKVKS